MPHCANCNNEYELPVYRNTVCPECGRELKTCKNCQHYAPDMANFCREPVSEPVQDKDRANFCDWFTPALTPHRTSTSKTDTARQAFAALFSENNEN